ncbi:hypothetical protein FA95DRAFT_1553709 [Auriscalpium vulgare]|uniref:Uncharacterized protein n=1 Tax=Auriscalpium vulgare TaxID=40419 RepID=A0ACB8S7J4_9AGAM|nr:hypothetical protein FA95DRAFT_1553709 [Auriscalpium vulgare]
MFKLLRRISSSVYPRPDRPWSDDATSNAPTIGRKRARDDDDEDMPDVATTRKRRGQLDREDSAASEIGELGSKGKETDPAVKEVTLGVEEVELDEKKEEGVKSGDVKVELAEKGSEKGDDDGADATPSAASAGVSEEKEASSAGVSEEKEASLKVELPAADAEATPEEPVDTKDTSAVDEPPSDPAALPSSLKTPSTSQDPIPTPNTDKPESEDVEAVAEHDDTQDAVADEE